MNEAVPVAPASALPAGVKRTLLPTTTAWPLTTFAADVTVSGSPSGSVSLARTSTSTVRPSTTVAVSALASGGWFGSSAPTTCTSTCPTCGAAVAVVDLVRERHQVVGAGPGGDAQHVTLHLDVDALGRGPGER